MGFFNTQGQVTCMFQSHKSFNSFESLLLYCLPASLMQILLKYGRYQLNKVIYRVFNTQGQVILDMNNSTSESDTCKKME